MKKDDKKFAKEELGNLERYEDVTKSRWICIIILCMDESRRAKK